MACSYSDHYTDRFHCIERSPAHTVTTRDRSHCIERSPAHTVTTRDRSHCIERWPAHTVTTTDRFHCILHSHHHHWMCVIHGEGQLSSVDHGVLFVCMGELHSQLVLIEPTAGLLLYNVETSTRCVQIL